MAFKLEDLVPAIILRQFTKSSLFKRETRKYLERKVLAIRNEMLEEFDQHLVTQEIMMGPTALNISGTLPGGEGNLFSFIGFEKGSSPIKDLRSILKSYRVRFTSVGGTRMSVKVSIPSRLEAFKVTPMPWAKGRSWVKGIEHGISGLGRYLYSRRPGSRSGEAIQIKKKFKPGKFRNTGYVSRILKNYKQQIRRLERRF